MKIKDSESLITKFSDTEIKELVSPGFVGIEKENLRIENNNISLKDHPLSLGSALCNKFITTDFSEGQIELITPPKNNISAAINFLDELNHFVSNNIGNEMLWPFSMPPYIESENKIPISNYGTSNLSILKMRYRNGLSHRYGRLMQTISGIHFNYSYSDDFWKIFLVNINKQDQKRFKSSYYFRALRNIRRLNWLILYFFGASPAVTENFAKTNNLKFKQKNDFYYLPFATSLRMSSVGYQNNKRSQLSVSTNSLNDFINDLEVATQTESTDFLEIYKNTNDPNSQLNANILQIEDEYYEIVRPKSNIENQTKLSSKLRKKGVNYIELRSVDLNPFCRHGIDLETIQLLEALVIYSGLIASPSISGKELEEIKSNDNLVAMEGRKPGLMLRRNQEKIGLKEWGNQILDDIQPITSRLGVNEELVSKFRNMLQQPELTLSGKMNKELLEEHTSYNAMAEYYSNFYKNYYQSLNKEKNSLWMHFEKEASESIQKQSYLEQNTSQPFNEFLDEYYMNKS